MKRLLGKRRVAILCVAVVAVAATTALLLVFSSTKWPQDAMYASDGESLRQALETAAPGETIVLRSGVSYEGPFCVKTDGITLGSSDGAILVGGGDIPCLSVEADGVTVSGLTFRAESIAIRVAGSNDVLTRVRVMDTPIGVQLSGGRSHRIEDVSIEGGRTGLEVSSSGGNTFDRVTIHGASELGIHLLGAWTNGFHEIEIEGAPIGLLIDSGSTDNEIRGLLVRDASVAGVEARSSSGNSLIGSELVACGIGVFFDVVSDCLVERSTIRDSGSSAVVLQRSASNRVVENTILSSQDAGISLTQSAENTVANNNIIDCDGIGIRMDGSDGCLLLSNEVRSSGNGIEMSRSSQMRVLRNVVRECVHGGMILRGGTENRLLDNKIEAGDFGIASIDTDDGAFHRNVIRDAVVVGLVVSGEGRDLALTETTVVGCPVGVLFAGTREASLLDGRFVGNGTGVVLASTRPGMRIEGNEFSENDVGLLLTSRVSDDASRLAGYGIELPWGEPTALPVVHHNLFKDCGRLDIWNQTETELSAGNNWWSESEGMGSARVSTAVNVEASAWTGVVAIGSGADTYQVILGRLVQQGLGAEGYRVIDLIGLGSDERLGQALAERDVDLVWMVATPNDEALAGMTSIPTKAARSWIVVATAAFAEQLGEQAISQVAALAREGEATVRWAVPKALGTEGLAELFEVYEIDPERASVTWTESLDESEALVKFSLAHVAVVENLQEGLTASDFVSLDDDLAAFEQVPIASVIRPALLAEHPDIGRTIENLTGNLSTEIIHGWVNRVRLLDRSPDEVAQEYLQRSWVQGG